MIKKIENFISKNYGFIFFILIVALVFIRLYKLNMLFAGTHIDEAGIYYDAYTLANFKVDRYLNPFPVYMINYGGG